MSSLNDNPWPYATEQLPGIGGTLKSFPEDFVVEELPCYEPCDDGTHVFFEIEKNGLTTPAAANKIASALGRRVRDVGYAGMKDASAVTRQVMSLEHITPSQVLDLELPRIRVLWARHHTNKLKLGHLRGNRFHIRVRDVHAHSSKRAASIVDQLVSQGVPNYFGDQRFGFDHNNHHIGQSAVRSQFESAIRLLLQSCVQRHEGLEATLPSFDAQRFEEAANTLPHHCRNEIIVCRTLHRHGGDYARAWFALDPKLRRLYISACQSALFNDVLAHRINEYDQLQQGDIAIKHVNQACFDVDHPDMEQPRCKAFEISPSGPMFGHRMRLAGGSVGKLEEQVLSSSRLTLPDFASKACMKMPGERRALRVPLEDVSFGVDEQDDRQDLLVQFTLPAGSYATTVLGELCKT